MGSVSVQLRRRDLLFVIRLYLHVALRVTFQWLLCLPLLNVARHAVRVTVMYRHEAFVSMP